MKRMCMGQREQGQGLVEYGLIIALVALAVIGALAVLGTSVSGLFQSISGAV